MNQYEKILELDKILEMLAEKTSNEISKHMALELKDRKSVV